MTTICIHLPGSTPRDGELLLAPSGSCTNRSVCLTSGPPGFPTATMHSVDAFLHLRAGVHQDQSPPRHHYHHRARTTTTRVFTSPLELVPHRPGGRVGITCPPPPTQPVCCFVWVGGGVHEGLPLRGRG